MSTHPKHSLSVRFALGLLGLRGTIALILVLLRSLEANDSSRNDSALSILSSFRRADYLVHYAI